jgi:hypothetical protein
VEHLRASAAFHRWEKPLAAGWAQRWEKSLAADWARHRFSPVFNATPHFATLLSIDLDCLLFITVF